VLPEAPNEAVLPPGPHKLWLPVAKLTARV
jgi:hypothetical protein